MAQREFKVVMVIPRRVGSMGVLAILQRMRTCDDQDEDCDGVENHLGCWLHDSGKGMCPYLRAKRS